MEGSVLVFPGLLNSFIRLICLCISFERLEVKSLSSCSRDLFSIANFLVIGFDRSGKR